MIMKKVSFSNHTEYDTDMSANREYATKEDAIKRVKALEVLNEDSNYISYIIVQKAEGIVQGE
jgi:hypothetical protein